MDNPRLETHKVHLKTMHHWVDGYLNKLSDDELKLRLHPNGNHGIWLLGHLIASDDDLSLYVKDEPLLFPEYQDLFAMTAKCLETDAYPDAERLRAEWVELKEKNLALYDTLTDQDLDKPHAKVKGDPKDDYFGTIENILVHWSGHELYHCGQLGVLLSQLGKAPY